MNEKKTWLNFEQNIKFEESQIFLLDYFLEIFSHKQIGLKFLVI